MSFLFPHLLLFNIQPFRKQKTTLDNLNNKIEEAHFTLTNISNLTDLEEKYFYKLQQNISKTRGKISNLGKHLSNREILNNG